MSFAVSIANLTKQYGAFTALQDLTLDVPHGSMFGLLGPTGAGKTTTIKILVGLIEATRGSVWVNGVPVSRRGEHRRHLGYLAQDPNFYPWMTGREVLEYTAEFYGGAPRSRLNDLLDRAGLAKVAQRPCRTYSAGMRQRLGIAQALVGRPAVVILDEPGSALDPLGRAEILALLQSLRDETTVVFSTHSLEDVQRISDYVAILNKGQLVKTAPTQALLSSYSNGSLRIILVGADDTTLDALRAIPGVRAASLVEHAGDRWIYTLRTAAADVSVVQRAITRFAGDRGLTLITNEALEIDLETVFLRLLGVHLEEVW